MSRRNPEKQIFCYRCRYGTIKCLGARYVNNTLEYQYVCMMSIKMLLEPGAEGSFMVQGVALLFLLLIHMLFFIGLTPLIALI